MSTVMKHLEKRHTSQDIKFLLWCDRMDLLAIANSKGEVFLHRLNWQLVWCLQPNDIDVTVSGLAWRPDGKVIAVGYSCGNLLLVDVETKRILYTQTFSNSISCILWLNAPDLKVDCLIEDDASTFLSDLPDLSWDTSTINKVIADETLVDEKNINMLLVGTDKGTVHISIFGLFECAVINLSDSCPVLSIHMTNDLSCLYAIVHCSHIDAIQVFTLDTKIFQTHSAELLTIAYKHGKIISLLNYLEGTISSIEAAWETILMEMDSKLASFASSVPEGAVASDFLDLLLFGVPSYDLDLFLAQDLTEKGLRKLGHSIECSYSNIQKLVLKHLTKVGQNITYHLSELRGMSRLEFRYKVLGLSEETVSKTISASGSFLVKGAEMQQVIDHSMRNYKAFFRWLYVVILRNNEEHVPAEISKVSQRDITFIGEFLKNFESLPDDSKQARKSKYFNLERLGQYLVDSDLTIPLDTALNPWNVFLESNLTLFDSDLIIKHHHNMSLIQEHKNLVANITNVFNEPKSKISGELQLNEILGVIKISKTISRISMVNFCPNFTFLAVTSHSDPEYLYFFELEINTQMVKKCGIFYFQPSENSHENIYAECMPNKDVLKIIDLQFYNANTLSVLLEIDSSSQTSVFAQFSTVNISEHLDVINLSDFVNKTMLPLKNACSSIFNTSMKIIEGSHAVRFAVSGARKVSVVMMANLRTVHLYEMEVEEEDEDDEGDAMFSTTKESDSSIVNDLNEQTINE